MPLFEDVQIEVNRIFGEDASMVSITPMSSGYGFHVSVGADGYDVTDWSEMDRINELFEYFQRDFC